MELRLTKEEEPIKLEIGDKIIVDDRILEVDSINKSKISVDLLLKKNRRLKNPNGKPQGIQEE